MRTRSKAAPARRTPRSLEARVRRLTVEIDRHVAAKAALDRELDSLSHSVSHDLRAPLRVIEGFSRILIEDHAAALGPEGRRVAEVIRQNTRTLACQIDDLLQLSRAGRAEVRRLPVDMTRAAERALAEVRAGSPERRVEASIPPLPPVTGDPTLLGHVWFHLLANAVKFTATRDVGHIEIAGRVRRREVQFSVRDDGIGFDMRHADRLFGVFQRLHPAERFPGTGMGLALVRRIIERHGGRVWAEGREDADAGATFHFTLPASVREGRSA